MVDHRPSSFCAPVALSSFSRVRCDERRRTRAVDLEFAGENSDLTNYSIAHYSKGYSGPLAYFILIPVNNTLALGQV